MRFLLVTTGTGGDVRPYIALAKELQLLGHEVVIATSYNLCELICDFEIDCIPMKLYASGAAKSFFNFRLINAVRNSTETHEEYLSELWSTCREAEADVIIYNASNYCCFYIADKLGLPNFGAFMQPYHLSGDFPHPILASGRPSGRIFNKLGFWTYGFLHWQHVRRSINLWRKKTLHLPAFSFRDILLRQMNRTKARILYGFSSSFLPKPADWHLENTVITGYWFLEKKGYIPPMDLSLWLSNGTPPVFISIAYNFSKFSKEILVRLLDLLDYRVVIHDVFDELKEMTSSENFFRIKGPVPHEWLFKKIAVSVHHGGLGICMTCIKAAIPMIIVPCSGINDTRFWGHRVYRTGVGILLSGPYEGRQFPEKLASAIRSAMNNDDMKQKVTDMSEQVKRENGLQNAVRFIMDEVSKIRQEQLDSSATPQLQQK